MALELDVPFDTIAHALSEFSGAERRFQFKGEEKGITVVDDYGHHPTEVKATLSAARIGAPEPAHRGAVSAASLLAHGRSDGRVCQRVQ